MIDALKSLIQQFMPFAQEKMGFSHPPRLFLRQDEQNAADPMGKTGFYDPEAESVTLYISGRHPKDIMRSLAHELMHHTQKCNGEFKNVQNMGEEGYAQANPHMRTMEIQAYQASIVFRDWEDSTKGTIYYEHLQKGDNVSMSTKKWKNKELNGLLMEKFGFGFKTLSESLEKEYDLEENAGERIFAPNHYCAHHVVHEGKKAFTVDHNWSEKLQEVTEYDLKFEDGSIKRNVHVTELDILEGMKHGKRDDDEDDDHPPVKKAGKRGDKKELDEMGCPSDSTDSGAEITVIDDGGDSSHDLKPEEGVDAADHAVELVDELRDLIMKLTGGEEMDMEQETMEESGLGDRPENKHKNKPKRGRKMDEAKLYKTIKEELERIIKGN